MNTSQYTTRLIVLPPSSISDQDLQQGLIGLCQLPVDLAVHAWRWVNTREEKVSIELVRQLQTQLAFGSSLQVVVLRNIDTATEAAQNALLKIVEEPPKQTFLILCTQQINQVLPTIQSRTIILHFPQKTQPLSSNNPLPFDLDSVSLSSILAWSETLSDRAEAQQICHSVISQILREPQYHLHLKKIKQLQLLQSAWDDLQQNAQVKLCVEHYFFLIAQLN